MIGKTTHYQHGSFWTSSTCGGVSRWLVGAGGTRASSFSSSSSTSSSSSSSMSSMSKDMMKYPLFTKMMIVNRGEIACRIIRTCRQLDIPTLAVYSSADGKDCLHSRLADESYMIGTIQDPTASNTYLQQYELMNLAMKHNVDSIHPGYGFLSERSSFCKLVEDTNSITFIGPSSTSMHDMGSKSISKSIMDKAGVPTVPGYYSTSRTSSKDNNEQQQQEGDDDDDDNDVELLRHEANKIGYPVLIKAIMGGGGKGMRVVWNDIDFIDALSSCQNEAASSFGDNRVLIEKYLIHPRHIEIQIVADKFGNVVHLYERDCSIQRRHQKIIEEAPTNDLSMELRQQLGTMAIRATKAVQYHGVGTVEFLLDTNPIVREQNPMGGFYFCEMNTRLQVEHPITECIMRGSNHNNNNNIDLVEWQIRVAANQELPIKHQEDIPKPIGHAFEARIYAEQPYKGFIPSTGHVWYHQPPTTTTNDNDTGDGSLIRVDTGIQSGQDISVYYDPMISKLIVHHRNGREEALQTLIRALQNYKVAGVETNIDFLIQCATHPMFHIPGATNTGFIENYGHDLFHKQPSSSSPLANAIGTFAIMLHLERRIQMSNGGQNKHHDKQNITAPTPAISRSNGGGGGGNRSSSLSNVVTNSAKVPWSSHFGSWRMGGELGRAQRKLQLVHHNDHEGRGDTAVVDSDDAKQNSAIINCISNHDGSFDISILPQPQPPTMSAEEEASKNSSTSTSFFHIDGVWDIDGSMEVIVNQNRRIRLTTILREEKDIICIHMWPDEKSRLTATTMMTTATTTPTAHHHDDDIEYDINSNYHWKLEFKNPMYPVSLLQENADNNSNGVGIGSTGIVKAPMPGKVTRILGSSSNSTVVTSDEGEEDHPINKVVVKKGDVIIVMEAMKMEHTIKSPIDGIIKEIKCDVNDIVHDGSILFIVEENQNQMNE